MPVTSNKELKKLISGAAIKHSLIPVIVCDENFRVCQKSSGAVRLIPKPAVNGSVLPHLSGDTAKKIVNGDIPLCTFFTTPVSEVFTIITEGTVGGEKYYALIFEPRILFLPREMPGYIAESYRHLSDAVKELLSTSEENFSRFERSVATMLRLTEFWEKKSMDELSAKVGFTDIYRELEIVINEYTELLSTVGAAINLRRLSDEPQICVYPSEIIHVFASVLVAAAILLSVDGYADVTCGTAPAKDSHAKISIEVALDKNDGKIESFQDLAACAVPLSLELAAIMDMAEHYGFDLNCSRRGDKLSIVCEIEIRRFAAIKLHASMRHTAAVRLRRMIAELVDIVSGSRQF